MYARKAPGTSRKSGCIKVETPWSSSAVLSMLVWMAAASKAQIPKRTSFRLAEIICALEFMAASDLPDFSMVSKQVAEYSWEEHLEGRIYPRQKRGCITEDGVTKRKVETKQRPDLPCLHEPLPSERLVSILRLDLSLVRLQRGRIPQRDAVHQRIFSDSGSQNPLAASKCILSL
jgi:hypothetical protein